MRAILEGNGQTFSFRTTKYNEDLKDELKALVPSSMRSWNPGSRGYGYRSRSSPGYWEISAQYWDKVIGLCKKYNCAVETNGIVDKPSEQIATFTLDYMGLLRHRGGDTYTASGWVNHGWNATFPLEVLRNWFGFNMKPGDAPTLYSVLSISDKAAGAEIKKAYRKAARTWHPDVCKEPDAEEQFKKIQGAYENLCDPLFRKRYDAGLYYQKAADTNSSVVDTTAINWVPPVRCGTIKAKAIVVRNDYDREDRYVVNKILAWDDIVNRSGETRVTYWSMEAKGYREKWVA